MPILELTSRAQRPSVRRSPLRPVVLIGDNGLTEAVLKEIDRALTSHGLIKVRAGGDDREAREAMLSEICDKLSCAPVHHLGKTLILFRQLPGNIKPAALAALEPERPAKRRASEPHTPKKLAAEGKTLSKRPARRADPTKPRPSRRASRPASSTRTASPCARAPARHPAAPTRFRAARAARSACAPEPAAAPAAARRPSAESGTSKTIRRSACLRRDCPARAFRLGTAPRRSSPGAAPSNTGVGSDEEPAATKRAHYAPDPP